jgi:hypothetical protein
MDSIVVASGHGDLLSRQEPGRFRNARQHRRRLPPHLTPIPRDSGAGRDDGFCSRGFSPTGRLWTGLPTAVYNIAHGCNGIATTTALKLRYVVTEAGLALICVGVIDIALQPGWRSAAVVPRHDRPQADGADLGRTARTWLLDRSAQSGETTATHQYGLAPCRSTTSRPILTRNMRFAKKMAG